MEIPLHAQVQCSDGVCGRSAYVIINPVLKQVTHLVVRQNPAPYTEYLVPVAFITATIVDTIQLRCTKADLRKMDTFVQTKYIEEIVPVPNMFENRGGLYPQYGIGQNYYMPYVIAERTVRRPVEERQIPPGELAMHRGTCIEATDGYVGKIDEFVVNPENGYITDLVMREGHLWGQKDVIIPVSVMGKSQEETVFLTLDKHQVESLPTFPMQRYWS